MTNLYHGSVYDQQELKPGFEHSGELIQWDGVESNKNLYTTTSRAEAISQAFAAILEKHFNSTRYKTGGKTIEVVLKGKDRPTLEQFKKYTIFLYTIRFDMEDGWKKVNNPTNGLDNEWKTTRTVKKNIVKTEKIDLQEWLKDKALNISMESIPIYAEW